MGHYCGNPSWVIIVAMHHGSLLWWCIMVHYCGNASWVIIVVVHHGSLLWWCIMGHYCGDAQLTPCYSLRFIYLTRRSPRASWRVWIPSQADRLVCFESKTLIIQNALTNIKRFSRIFIEVFKCTMSTMATFYAFMCRLIGPMHQLVWKIRRSNYQSELYYARYGLAAY